MEVDMLAGPQPEFNVIFEWRRARRRIFLAGVLSGISGLIAALVLAAMVLEPVTVCGPMIC
jgi:hypothetical protein